MRFQSYIIINVFLGMLNYKCKRPLKVNNINVLTPNKKTFKKRSDTMLKNKVFVVTGGGNGIGREVVLHLLDKGSRVAAIDISEKGLLETKKLSNKSDDLLKTYPLDITNLLKVQETYQAILKDFNVIDGLIHVAGIIQPFVKVIDLEYEAINKVINVNLYGTLYLNKTFLPALLEQKEAYLVNVSSMGGFLPVPGQSLYGASKAAVKLFTEGLYGELKDTNVSVTCVFPGAIKTDIAKNSNVSIKIDTSEKTESTYKMLEADKAAELIVKAMLKKKLYSYVGKDSRIMNKFYRLSPRRATNMIIRKMSHLLQ